MLNSLMLLWNYFWKHKNLYNADELFEMRDQQLFNPFGTNCHTGLTQK